MSVDPQYPTDLSDAQWQLIESLLPAPTWQQGGRGRPPVDRRRVINGIFYLKKTGCQWRMLPRESRPSDTTSAIGAPFMGISNG